jgi:acyl carrier protein
LLDEKRGCEFRGATNLEATISKLCAIVQDVTENSVDISSLGDIELSQLNLDSLRLVGIIEQIETSFGIVLPAGDIYENIDDLTLHTLAEIIVNLGEEKEKHVSR